MNCIGSRRASDRLSRLAARSREGTSWVQSPSGRGKAFEILVPETGVAKYPLDFRREYWQLKGPSSPYLIWHWRLGHMSALTRVLGGDGTPACATNSSEQDDHAEVTRTPPGRGSLIVRAPYMVNCLRRLPFVNLTQKCQITIFVFLDINVLQ